MVKWISHQASDLAFRVQILARALGKTMAIGHHRTPEQYAELSGRVNERFVFGGVRVGDPAYEREKQALIQRYRDMKKPLDLREGLEVIKRFQPFKPDSREAVDPASPIKQFPYALRKFVAEGLGLKGAKEENVLFWTAVDSFIDREFGADAVMEVKGEKGEPSRLVRLDVTRHLPGETTKEEKDNRDRVIIYGEIPDVHESKRAYDETVRRVGEEIIEKLNAQKAVVKHAA